MKTTDLFKFNRSSKRINESIDKVFGQKLNFETFDTEKLEDARNKLRTQIHTARGESGFNETIENEALTKAQWMHDAIVAELMDRQEHIVDNTFNEGPDIDKQELMDILKRFDENMNEIGGYGDPDFNKIISALNQGDVESAVEEVAYNYADQDGGEIRSNDMDNYLEDLEDQFKDLVGVSDDEGGDTDDAYALASAGHGSDEDYGFAGHDEGVETEGGQDAYQRDYDSSVSGMGRQERDWDEGDTEPANNFAVAINGKQWKVFKGRGRHADDMAEKTHFRQLQSWAAKKSEATGKKWTVHVTGEPATESINYENKEQTGDNMSNLKEGEIQQASAIVTAKTMVDRVGRWIEELSGMENDTLLTLGDSIRDEMGQEKAKAFISAVAPTIQQALENLKSTRETLSSGVRALTGEEQSAEMLGGEPGMGDEFGGDVAAPAEPDAMNAGGDEFGADAGLDDFAAAEPATGGSEEAGRAKRESIDRSNQLLKVLAG
jgi:hypothetical protein